MSALPPPYDPNANREPSQPAPATNMYVVEPPWLSQASQPGDCQLTLPNPNQPGEPIAMQPTAQPGMDTAGQKVTPLHLLGDRPEWIDCQMCHQRARTRVQTTGEGMQFLTGAILCLVCICLAPLPCCLHWFEQTNWYCEKCGKQVATRVPDAPVQVLPPVQAYAVPSQYAQPVPGHFNPQAAGSPPPQGHPQQPWPQQQQEQPQQPWPQQQQQQQQQPEIAYYAPQQQQPVPDAPEHAKH